MKQLNCCYCAKRTMPENRRFIRKETQFVLHRFIEKQTGRILDDKEVLHNACKMRLLRLMKSEYCIFFKENSLSFYLSFRK